MRIWPILANRGGPIVSKSKPPCIKGEGYLSQQRKTKIQKVILSLPKNKSQFEFLRCFKQIPLYVFHLQPLPPSFGLKKCPKKCQLVTLDNSKEADCGRAGWLAKNLFQSCQEGQPGISYCWPCPAQVATKRTGRTHISSTLRQLRELVTYQPPYVSLLCGYIYYTGL